MEREEPATETETLHELLDEYDIRTRPNVQSKAAQVHAEKLLIIDTLSFMHPPKVLKMIPNDNVSILETCIRKLVS